MKQFEKILLAFLHNTHEWATLKSAIQTHDFSGKVFEAFCKYYFLCEPTVKDDYLNVWYFEEIPSEVKSKLGFANIDYGVDLLLEDIDNQYIAVQCKFRSDENSKLSWSADKIANLFAYASKADGYIVFTNSFDIDTVSKSKENFALFSISHLLTVQESTFDVIKNRLAGQQSAKYKKHSPQEHQQEAINRCVEFFEIENRGQLIMPCGSGKTLTALWIKETLKAKNTLILVPSLSLLRQIKEDWARQKNTAYHYLCVCSENDIDNSENEVDSFVTHTYEIGGKVTTDAQVISVFLQKNVEKVIFSTYQSLPQIEKALQNTDFVFDFVLCDEAHKTAGVNQGLFSIIHDNQRIPAQKRLYMTATPRIVSENIKKKLNENLQYAYDMSNPDIFGYEFYRMTFKQAIEKNILVDYKIITVGITDEQIAEYIKERRFISNRYTIEDLAHNFALETVMQKYEATHAITFHSRVRYAQAFKQRHEDIFADLKAFMVSGTQSTNERAILMNGFKNAKKAVMSNARCLTEGVDIPAIDLVYFCDPKNSKVDIVQATGRALRQDHKKGKKMGYIVIPIYHTRKSEVENAISNSNFKNLITVVRALCDQDERLQDEINQLAYGKGKSSNFTKLEFVSTQIFTEGKIHLVGFEERLKNNLFDQVIERNTDSWYLWYAKLVEYLEQNDYEYPNQEQNPTLYQWVSSQRTFYKKRQLSLSQIEKLESINFIWDTQDYNWHKRFEELVAFRLENPEKWPAYDRKGKNNNDLAILCQQIRKRYKENTLSEYWLDKLLSINFNFEGTKTNWLNNYEQLQQYVEKHHTFPDTKQPFYQWCNIQRNKYKENTLSQEQKALLDQINFMALYEKGQRSWEKMYDDLYAFYQEHGCLPLYKKENSEIENSLGNWLIWQKEKHKRKELSDEQIEKLSVVGFFDQKNGKNIDIERWNEQFESLKLFVQNSQRLPSSRSSDEEKNLFNWWQAQRVRENDNTKRKPLQDWQVKKLESIGFSFDTQRLSWEERYEQLRTFCTEKGLANLQAMIDGKMNPLYKWLSDQKVYFKKGKLEADKVQLLADLGVDMQGKELTGGLKGKKTDTELWENHYQNLKNFIESTGKNLPSRLDGKTNPLYAWYHTQKRLFKEGKLTEERAKKLQNLGML